MVDFQNLLDPILIIMTIIFIGFSVFIYRYTNPPVPYKIKLLLTALRSFAFFILILAIFNSVIGFNKNEQDVQNNLFFIDNSRSIALKDSTKKSIQINKFIAEYANKKSNQFLTFGSKLKPLGNVKPSFNEPFTNFEDIEKYISVNNSTTASVTIISDGIITDGANPLYKFEKLGIPVFTIGIGDTTRQSDITIQDPFYNHEVYRNRQVVIESKVLNKNLAGKNVVVNLYEENTLIDRKNILLSPSGVDNISFNYTPKNTGSKRLKISITPLLNESNKNNNSKSFIINVLNDKIKTLLISGSPSSDVTFLAEILSEDERIKLKSIVELNDKKYLKGGNSDFPIDSTDVFILVNYPSSTPNTDFFNTIKTQTINRLKPVLFSIGSNVDLNRLRDFSPILPITYSNNSSEEIAIEVYSDKINNPLITPQDAQFWEQFPPVTKTKTDFAAKPESDILLKAVIKNTKTSLPVIITKQTPNSKTEAIIAGNVWKWKLQSNKPADNLFDKFILNSIQWLNTPSGKKTFFLKSGKKVYSSGERIEITANVFDDLSNPVENAPVNLQVTSKTKSYNMVLQYIDNGVYKGEIENGTPGNLKIAGTVKFLNKTFSDSLNLFVEESEIEQMNTQMDANFLSLAANITGGAFYNIDYYSGLMGKIENLALQHPVKLKKSFEIHFASNEFILIILIILFTLEWVIRKIYRLI